MDQFDKIIKDKLNDKSYDYQPKAWRSFKHSSGMPMLSTGAKLALTAVVVTIVGSILYFTLAPNPQPQEAAVTAFNEQKTDNQQVDTIELTENVGNVVDGNIATSCPTSTVSQSQSKPQTQTPGNGTSAGNNEPVEPHQPKHISKTIYYHPTEILVDTISSIDFPDYEVRPADMLP